MDKDPRFKHLTDEEVALIISGLANLKLHATAKGSRLIDEIMLELADEMKTRKAFKKSASSLTN